MITKKGLKQYNENNHTDRANVKHYVYVWYSYIRRADKSVFSCNGYDIVEGCMIRALKANVLTQDEFDKLWIWFYG